MLVFSEVVGRNLVSARRPLRRVLQRQIEDPLALALLEGKYLEGATVTVGVEDDKTVLRSGAPLRAITAGGHRLAAVVTRS
jgi:ATP-dependent Clp protease ATP-binding subunit ClpA